MQIVEDADKLIADKWYAIGIKDYNDVIYWGGAPIYKYCGEGEWLNEHNDSILYVWDVVLQMNVSINSADAYMPQS